MWNIAGFHLLLKALGHPSYKAIFSLQKGWPYKRGTTVKQYPWHRRLSVQWKIWLILLNFNITDPAKLHGTFIGTKLNFKSQHCIMPNTTVCAIICRRESSHWQNSWIKIWISYLTHDNGCKFKTSILSTIFNSYIYLCVL
jgi:hypothetical protein